MLTNKEISNIQITWKTLSFPEIKSRLQELYHSDMSFLDLVSALYWDLIETKRKYYHEKDNQEALEKRDKMLRDTVEELCEVKRLLKMAVEDMQWINENTQDADGTCTMRKGKGCGGCPLDINGDLWCKWKHEDEALKLIGDSEN